MSSAPRPLFQIHVRTLTFVQFPPGREMDKKGIFEKKTPITSRCITAEHFNSELVMRVIPCVLICRHVFPATVKVQPQLS